MSDNTQAQGRTRYTERDFEFTPREGDDALRSLYRWEIELEEQLKKGNVIFDVDAKTAALNAPYEAEGLPVDAQPGDVTQPPSPPVSPPTPQSGNQTPPPPAPAPSGP